MLAISLLIFIYSIMTVRACGPLVNIYFIKLKFLETVNEMTASQNVERRHKSSIIVHPRRTAAVAQWIRALAPQVEVTAATDVTRKNR